MTEEIIRATKARMAAIGMSQNQLAKRLGIEPVNLSRMLNGRSGSVPKSWQRVLEELGLELRAVESKDVKEPQYEGPKN